MKLVVTGVGSNRPSRVNAEVKTITRRWWESKWYALALILLSAVPLLWPATPPFPDVPGHMGRYAIELYLAQSPSLQRFFQFHWALIGNLGVDLLIIPCAKLFGLELAVKLIVIAIPVLTTVGLFRISEEIHGRYSPATAFAIPFVYGFPLLFGFINFALSLGFALLGFAYWLKLTRQERYLFRSIIFVPMSCLIWLTHVFGWGILGLLVFSSELGRQRGAGSSLLSQSWKASRQVLPLAVPLILMLLWRSNVGASVTGGFLDPISKPYGLVGALRDRWLVWDCMALAVVIVVFWAVFRQKDFGFSALLAIPAATLGATFILMPGQVFGSAYADARLAPTAIMIGLLSIRGAKGNLAHNNKLATCALIFAILRLTGNTLSFAIADTEQKERLKSLDQIVGGARVLSLSGIACPDEWEMPRHFHLGAFVIVRRQGFSNDEWQANGAQLMRVNYSAARPFEADPSTLVYKAECLAKAQSRRPATKLDERTLDAALREFPRAAFNYVWILKPPETFEPPSDLRLIRKGRDSFLYEVRQ